MSNLFFSRRAVSPAIVLLVIAAASLSILALFYFNNVNKELHETIFLHAFVHEMNEKRFLLHFYIQDIFERSVDEFGENTNTETFLTTFQKNAVTYRYENGSYFISELAQLEMLGIESVSFENGEIALYVPFVIRKEKNLIQINYVYDEAFRKKIQ